MHSVTKVSTFASWRVHQARFMQSETGEPSMVAKKSVVAGLIVMLSLSGATAAYACGRGGGGHRPPHRPPHTTTTVPVTTTVPGPTTTVIS